MTRADLDGAVAELALRQSGAFSRSQVLGLGMTDRMIAARLRSRRWTRVAPGVYVLTGTDATEDQRRWLALLEAGPRAWLSHEAAAAVHGLPRFPVAKPVVTVPHGAHPRATLAIVHETRDVMRKAWITTVRGLPVSTVPRTIVEVAATSHVSRLARVIDDAVAARRTSYTEVGVQLGQVARHGKPGVVALARVLDDRGPGHVPPASEMERMMIDALDAAREPQPVRQHPYPGRADVGSCVDFAYPEARLVVETDGRRWHTRIADLLRDHQRDAEAARAGWLVLRVLYEQLRDDPIGTAKLIRDTRVIRTDAAA